MTDTPEHYDLPIQPVDYIVKNSLGFLEGNVIKYVTRHHDKGGVADIQKAIHYLALLLDTEYGVRADVTYYPRLAQRWQAPPVASGEIASNYYRRYANAH